MRGSYRFRQVRLYFRKTVDRSEPARKRRSAIKGTWASAGRCPICAPVRVSDTRFIVVAALGSSRNCRARFIISSALLLLHNFLKLLRRWGRHAGDRQCTPGRPSYNLRSGASARGHDANRADNLSYGILDTTD
jgi:hypothetical protein